MATQYINEDKKIIFLNNKNIAQNRTDIDAIDYNAIPSLSLFNDTYDSIEVSAYGISSTVTALSNMLSNEVSSTEKRAIEYTEQLSVEFKDISANLNGMVTVFDKHNNFFGNDISVRTLTNEQYDQLVANDQTFENMVYIINDNHYSARNQQIKNLGEPSLSSDAVTKNYVDTTENQLSTSVLNQANAYANSISSEPLNEAKTYVNNNCIQYNTVNFSYNKNTHKISLTIENLNNQSKILNVDATDFIANGIISEIHVNSTNKTLVITWSKPDGGTEDLEIPLNELFKVYGTVQNGGIDIQNTSNGFIISCDNSIARTDDLTSNYQPKGSYVETTDLNTTLSELSTSLSSYYIAKDRNSTTTSGIYTTYTVDNNFEGGIRVNAPNIGQFDGTQFGYSGIKITRNSEQNAQYFNFVNDNDNNGIARIKDLTKTIQKQEIYGIISSFNENSTFADVVKVLNDLKTLCHDSLINN